MKFVRSANTFEEQNLSLISKEHVSGNEIEIKFFFLTTRAIYAREELKVWYSREYAEKFNLKVLEPRTLFIQEVDEQMPAENIPHKSAPNPIDIVATGGHKLRNKIAKTQQQLQQQQQQQKQDTQQSGSQTDTNGASGQTKESSSQPKYQCETCQKVFPRFYSLRRHQIMHSGEKKYKCPVCGMSFSHVYNRNRHAKKHQKVAVNKKTALNLTESNEQNVSLKASEASPKKSNANDMKPPTSLTVARKSAPKTPNNNSNKPFRCHECYKCFTTDDRLIRHAIVHSSDEEVKPLACDICQKRFLNNSALSCHLKVHRFYSNHCLFVYLFRY